MPVRTTILLFCIVLSVYLLTPIRNRSEAEDAYAYALQVEATEAPSPHPHHMLYIPLARLLYGTVQGLGFQGRAHALLVTLSAVSGAGAVTLLGLLCRTRLYMSEAASVLTACLFAASYGFWRYACEAEIYAPATFLGLLTIYLAGSSRRKIFRACTTGAVAAAGVLVHVMNLLPAFVVAPLMLTMRRKARAALLYLVSAGGLVVVVYALCSACGYGGEGRAAAGPGLPIASLAEPSTYLRGAIGLGQAVVSGNFLFTIGSFRDLLVRLFPHRVLEEEFFMGQAAGMVVRGLAWVTLAGLVVAGTWMVRARLAAPRSRSGRPAGVRFVRRRRCRVAALWLILYAGTILVFEPGNPEMWIMGLPPLFLVAGCIVVEPLVRARGPFLPTLVLLALVAHNLVGGLSLLANPSGDYHAQRAAWILRNGRPGDTVFTAGNASFTRYLAYHASARVVVLNELTPDKMEAELDQASRSDANVYALDDLFDQPPARLVRFPRVYSHVSAFAETHASRFKPVAQDVYTTVYLLSAPPPVL